MKEYKFTIESKIKMYKGIKSIEHTATKI